MSLLEEVKKNESNLSVISKVKKTDVSEIIDLIDFYSQNEKSKSIVLSGGSLLEMLRDKYSDRENIHVAQIKENLKDKGFGSIDGGGIFLYIVGSTSLMVVGDDISRERNLGNGKSVILFGPPLANPPLTT